MGVFGRLIHYSADALFLAIILGAVHKQTGFALNVYQLTGSDTAQHYLAQLLGIGETIYEVLCQRARRSSWFKRSEIKGGKDLRDRLKHEMNDLLD